jgi:FkbM family methyltransferase
MGIRALIESAFPAPVTAVLKRYRYRRFVEHSKLDDETDLAILPKVIKPDFVCLDIGANLGVYAKHLSRLCQQVRAFEPIPETFSYLTNNVAALRLQNVVLAQAAVCDHLGTVSMEIPKWPDGRANIYESHITADQGDIPALTIDSLNLPRCDFIKCDVEGHEISVVNGARETIRRSKPIWLIESDWDSQLFPLMTGLGYTCCVARNGELYSRQGAERATNYWFVWNTSESPAQ